MFNHEKTAKVTTLDYTLQPSLRNGDYYITFDLLLKCYHMNHMFFSSGLSNKVNICTNSMHNIHKYTGFL